jgi:hypothetical protein
MDYHAEGISGKLVFWTVMEANIAKITLGENSSPHPAGKEFSSMALTLASSDGQLQMIMLQPGEGAKLMQSVIMALSAYGWEPAQEISRFLAEKYPEQQNPDRL